MRASLSGLSVAYAVVAGVFGSAVYVVSHPAIGATLTNLPEIASIAADDATTRMQSWANRASDNYAGQITEWTGERPRNLLAEWYSPNPFAGIENADPVTKPQLRSSLLPQGEAAMGDVTAEIIVADAVPESADVSIRPRRDVEISETYFAPIRARQTTMQVEAGLQQQLTADHFARFDLFIYVSKADSGPFAQQMYVFTKEESSSESGAFHLLHQWPVSTGRETTERAPSGRLVSTATPAGYFQFDARRMFEDYHSSQWNGPMPHAMFFNWMDHGRLTGVAIHGTVQRQVANLGYRSSAGCVRLSPDAATILFDLVKENYRGKVPGFAYDQHTSTLSRDGTLERNDEGGLQLSDGYRVLIFIDNYGGEPSAIF